MAYWTPGQMRKTNPIQTQYKANTNPIKAKIEPNKANSNPIYPELVEGTNPTCGERIYLELSRKSRTIYSELVECGIKQYLTQKCKK